MGEDDVKDVVAAVTYNSEKNKFLLVKRSSTRKRYPNEWEFPSGFLEDESEQNGALRELKEETGLVGEVIRTGEPFEVKSPKYSFRIHPVLVKVEESEIKLTREHEESEWVEKDDIEGYNTVPQLKEDMEAVGIH